MTFQDFHCIGQWVRTTWPMSWAKELCKSAVGAARWRSSYPMLIRLLVTRVTFAVFSCRHGPRVFLLAAKG
ncbi:unnamed protein product [Prunus armeniaca]